MLGVKCSPGLGDGLPGPLATGFRFAPPFSCAPGATDGDGGVVGESIRSCICCSPILLGARLGTGGGGGGGMIISLNDIIENDEKKFYQIVYSQLLLALGFRDLISKLFSYLHL